MYNDKLSSKTCILLVSNHSLKDIGGIARIKEEEDKWYEVLAGLHFPFK
jgi:hypothetical protein